MHRPRPETVRLDVTRDTWVSEVGAEADGNNGGASRLKVKGYQEMSLDRRRPGAAQGPGGQGGDAPPEAGRGGAAAARHRRRRGGRVVRGDRLGLREAAGRGELPPSPPSRPGLVDRPPRRGPLPRDPGQRRDALGHGRRDGRRTPKAGSTSRSTRQSSRPGPRGSRTGSWSSTTPARNGPATGRDSRSVCSPTGSSTAATRTARVRLPDGDARPGRPAAAGGPGRIAVGDGRLAPRRGDRLVGHAPRRRARPGRSASSPRSMARPCPAS